jgi:hypothetical protein
LACKAEGKDTNVFVLKKLVFFLYKEKLQKPQNKLVPKDPFKKKKNIGT